MVTFSYPSRIGYHLTFQAHPKDSNWPSAGGIYLFARRPDLRASLWQALYVGTTHSLSDRLPCHERWAEAVAQGATDVAICLVANGDLRDSLERDLVDFTQAPLNTHFKQSTNTLRTRFGVGGLPSWAQ